MSKGQELSIDGLRRSTQCESIISHLKSGRTITQSEALDLYGIERLASRISDLRKRGFDILTKSKPVHSRFSGIVYVAEYELTTAAKRCNRLANVGEYVETTVGKDVWGYGFEKGEIVQAIECDGYDGSVRCRNKEGQEYYLFSDGYVVLENY